MNYAPVVITVFNRPEHTQKTLKALAENELAPLTDLYIFSDGPRNSNDMKKVEEVRQIIHNVSGFNKIIIEEYPENKGLAKSTIYCMSKVINERGVLIGMEDDLVTEKYFLNVMNQMLAFYEKDKRVGSVSSFMLSSRMVHFPKSYKEDIFFNVRPVSSGWGTWKNRWNLIDWNMNDLETILKEKTFKEKIKLIGDDFEKILKAYQAGDTNSWSIRWLYNNLKYNLVTVETTTSYLDTIGYDASGTHCIRDESYFFRQEKMAEKKELKLFPYEGKVNVNLVKAFSEPFSFGITYIKRKLYSKFGILIK